MIKTLSTALSLCSAAVLSLSFIPSAQAAEEVGPSESHGVNLTIYNQNFGVVKDVRSMTLKQGLNVIRFSDVASEIDPTSVSLQSLTAPNSLVVREQNYQYDLINPTTILSKSIGKTLKFRQILENGTVHEFSGTLLNAPQSIVASSAGGLRTEYSGLVIKTDSGVILNPVGEIELAELPPGLISKPSLVWKVETTKAGTHETEVAYQTQGLNWKADYVAILNKDDNQLDLNSWVTLDNQSGASYHNAALKLLAGDVHRVQPQLQNVYAGAAMRAAAAPEPQFQEASFAEYHLYTLQGKTDVLDKQTKQMSLFNASKIPAKKLFIFDAQRNGYVPRYNPNGNQEQKVQVKIEVENTTKNGLGMAMPKGKVRVYKRDQDGALQFIGEDEIDHTPRDEKVRLYIGDAFDLVGERKLMHQENVASRVQHTTYEVSLRNHKDVPVTITYVDHPNSNDWTILNSSQPYVRRDAHNVDFPVQVPANGEVKINYQIETRW